MKLFVMGLIAGGVHLSLVNNEEMNMFLESTFDGEIPSPENLYNNVAFPIEQKMLEDVCLFHGPSIKS